jgi:hypothetical protein
VNILYNIHNTDLERIKQMTSKREYLVSKGITVGRRGRFSSAAKNALAEAEKQGIKFTSEAATPKK